MPSLHAVAVRSSILVAALAALASAQAPTYHAEYLGSAVHVAAMNDAGLVVGQGSIGIYPRAWVAGPGKPITYLPLPFGFLSSTPTDINEAGVIIGNISPYSTTAFYPQPARWDPNGSGGWTVTRMDTLPGDNRGTADAINDVGDILGTSAYQANSHVVLYTPGGPVDLPTLKSLPAREINDQRQYVSGHFRVDLDTLAVQDLGGAPGYASTDAWEINSLGQVAADLAGGGCGGQVGLYTDGAGWQLVGDCAGSGLAWELNDSGDVLMELDVVPYLRLSGAGLYRVEDLIVADSGHWTVPAVNGGIAMNDGRQIALYATNGGLSGIVLLTPDTGMTCQADLGFGGPGTLALSMCGGDLSAGTTADIALSGGKAGLAWLLAGLVQSAAPFKGGTLVPVPWVQLLPLPLDASGQGGVPGVPGGLGALTVYVQSVQADAAQPHGWAVSNALRVEFKP